MKNYGHRPCHALPDAVGRAQLHFWIKAWPDSSLDYNSTTLEPSRGRPLTDTLLGETMFLSFVPTWRVTVKFLVCLSKGAFVCVSDFDRDIDETASTML
jgi:hypothetical protein